MGRGNCPLTGNVVVEDVAHVDFERAPRCVLQEPEGRQEAAVLLDDVHLLRPAGQQGARDAPRTGPDFHHDLATMRSRVTEKSKLGFVQLGQSLDMD